MVRVKRNVSKFLPNFYSECRLILRNTETFRSLNFKRLWLAYGLPRAERGLLQCVGESVLRKALKTAIKIGWFHEKNIFRGPTFTNIDVCVDSAWSGAQINDGNLFRKQ